MPVPTATTPQDLAVLPDLSKDQIDAARTSRWYETFEDFTIPSTIINLSALGEQDAFMEWLESDSIFLPEGSEQPEPSSSPDTDEEEGETAPVYRLPRLNEAIRAAMSKYGGAVFPKLNWTSPRDAAFILPQSTYGPCYCQTPSDIYLLIKSSDFISHDLDPARAYASGPSDEDDDQIEGGPIAVELVLKRFERIQPSREFRCFVRNRILVGISQRDLNYYDYLQALPSREKLRETIKSFWEDEIWDNYDGGDDYVFDLYLSEDLNRCTIIDFNPYRQSTDPLLWTYSDLRDTLLRATTPITSGEDEDRPKLPVLKVIESEADPSASHGGPTYGTSMMPLEMVEMSQGRSLGEFTQEWEDAVRRGLQEHE